jgi:phosphonate transport system ATP-binding protein
MNAPRLAERSLTGPTSPGPVLTVTGLVKSFDGPPILNGVAFALAPGQSTALIGANGSGKSTLLKCLIRLIEPTEGRIEMLGRDVRALGPRD